MLFFDGVIAHDNHSPVRVDTIHRIKTTTKQRFHCNMKQNKTATKNYLTERYLKLYILLYNCCVCVCIPGRHSVHIVLYVVQNQIAKAYQLEPNLQ